MSRPYTSHKIIKKSRIPKTCRGCGKEIPVGSTHIQIFEFLQIRFANDPFCSVKCIEKAAKQFFGQIDSSFDTLRNLGVDKIQMGKQTINLKKRKK